MRLSRRKARRGLAGAGLSCIAVFAAACGSSASPAVTATKTVTVTPSASASTASPGAVRSSGSPPAVAPCSTRDLQVKVGARQGAAGSTFVALDFTNIGTATCTIFGYPGVSLAGGQRPAGSAGRPRRAPRTRGGLSRSRRGRSATRCCGSSMRRTTRRPSAARCRPLSCRSTRRIRRRRSTSGSRRPRARSQYACSPSASSVPARAAPPSRRRCRRYRSTVASTRPAEMASSSRGNPARSDRRRRSRSPRWHGRSPRHCRGSRRSRLPARSWRARGRVPTRTAGRSKGRAGGTLTVESAAGSGTTVNAAVPLAVPRPGAGR